MAQEREEHALELGRTLFWTTIGLVAGSFVLALVGEETSSTHVREQILNWHEWLGLLSLLTLIAALITQWFDKHPRSLPLPHWLPWLRGAVGVFLYILLLLQPLSGWLLASHEGKLASFFGWMLPPLPHRVEHLLTMVMSITVLAVV